MQRESRMIPEACRPSQAEVSDEVTDGADVVAKFFKPSG